MTPCSPPCDRPDNAAPMARRRFIQIAAAAAGLALHPVSTAWGAAAGGPLRTWRGTVLGADASLAICHPDPQEADRLIGACLAEAARLEGVFSLYRADSAIRRLNRDGHLAHPPFDLVRLLATARQFGRLTRGAFDPTVQSLWELYAAHFSSPDADPDGPNPAALRHALQRVDYRAIDIGASRISFAKPGMAITLNGIAQGYITDRVVDLLRANGIGRTLVDMGEIRALGRRPDGNIWSVGLADPVSPGHVAMTLALENRAVATSGGYGFQFDPAGRFNHLFDPRSGRSSHRFRSVSVVADTATTADALSTAFSVMAPAEAGTVAARLGVRSYAVLADGSRAVAGL